MSTLSLFQTCPPGLGGSNCSQATCQSPYIAPASRTAKPDSDQQCSSCDQGFTGINCNVCAGQGSCQAARARVDPTFVPSTQAAALGFNQSLTCYPQPEVITQSYTDCDVNQPTISSFFPGSLKLSLTRVLNPANISATGQPAWPAQNASTLSSIWLDGVEQFYCQAQACTGANQTAPAVSGQTPKWGTYNWTCSNPQCYCIPGTKMCGGGGPIDLTPFLADISGSLGLPCDYIDPSNTSATHSCAFKADVLQNFFGENGLPLQNCRSGACLVQDTLDQHWANEDALAGKGASANSDASQLTGGVIAGLAVLGLVIIGLLGLVGLGLRARRRAALKPRSPPTGPVGLRWKELSYTLAPPSPAAQKAASALALNGLRHRRRGGGGHGSSPSAGPFGLTPHSHKSQQEADIFHMDNVQNPNAATDGNSSTSNVLLQSVSGYAAPGNMVAILGASGAGKTTLLDLLAGRAKAGFQGGNVSYLYSHHTPTEALSHSDASSSSKLIAYVDQEDKLPALATVREALEFAATLSNPENALASHEHTQLVNRTIDVLGLTHVANRRIGDSQRRGISGGEKRRVSIGLALVARPRILILDEPLSGLDSYSADRVIEALRKLAAASSSSSSSPTMKTREEGATVIMTLHQPSSLIFDTFDDVILLAPGGKTVYHGTPAEALGWCERNGEPCPPGHNVADHLLLVSQRFKDNFAGGQIQSQSHSQHRHRHRQQQQEEEQQPSSQLQYQIGNGSNSSHSHGGLGGNLGAGGGGGGFNEKGVSARSSFSEHINATATVVPDLRRQQAHLERDGDDDDAVVEEIYKSVLRPRGRTQVTDQAPTTFFTQVLAVSGRFWRHALRDPSGPVAHLGITVAVGLIIGGCFWQVSLSIGGFQNRFGSILFSFIYLAFLAMSAATNVGAHRALMIRERANGLYTPFAWLLSFVVYDLLLLRVASSIVLSLITYFMIGYNTSSPRFFFEFVLVSVLFTVDMALYNMVLASGIEDLSSAVLTAGANILFQLGFAGFLLNVHSIPAVLRWLQWIAALKYAMEAVGSNELKGLRIVDSLGGVPVDAPASLIAPTLFGFEPFYYRDVLVLALPFLLGFFGILTFIVHQKMRELR